MSERCRIGYYVSHATPYGRAELRLRAQDSEGRVVAESSVFKGDAAFGPNRGNAEHQQALETLLETLRRDGWRVAGQEEPWYALRLERGA